MRGDRSPWLLLATVVLAVGAVLLMHGLDAHAASNGAAVGEHDHGHHEEGDCPDCGVAHVLAACLGVVGLAAALGLTRARPVLRPRLVPARSGPPLLAAEVPLRPPKWVELSVMRC